MNHNTMKPTLVMVLRTLPRTFSLLHKNDPGYLIVMLLEVVAFSIDKYPALLIMKYTIDALIRNIAYADYVKAVIPLVAVMLILNMIRVIVNTTRPCRDQLITENLFNAFFAKCTKIDYQTLERKEIQDKKELAKSIANGKIAAIGWYFVETFSSLIALIIATMFMFRINKWVLIIVMLGLLIKTHLAKKDSDKTVPIKSQQILQNRFLSYLYEIGSKYDYVKEFRIFDYKKRLLRKIGEEKKRYARLTEILLRYDCLQSIVGNIQDFIVKLASFGIMGSLCLTGTAAISDFTFIIGLVDDYVSYSNSFAASCKSYMEATAYIEHYHEFMNYSDLSVSDRTGKPVSSSGFHVVEFRSVYFKYPGSDSYALRNVNLRFHTPMKISLVGRNGAGKSTLVKLLLRLYRPDEGQIILDGIDIYEYSIEEYMKLFSSVFQDFVLFAFSISDNITSLDSHIDQCRFERSVTETGVADFACGYPKGYETYLSNAYSNDGVEFSGGEQQKIALARCLYKENAFFFILDEPTSTYDADAEYQLYRKYEELLSDKASIFISHRLSSCKLSDYIVLLDNGVVIEEGSHSELMQKETQYKRMFELQANQYRWEDHTSGR